MDICPRKLYSFDTEFTADTVESCRNEPYFACGTYQLNTENQIQERVGNIALYEVSSTGNIKGTYDVGINRTQTVATPGVLDMKWSESNMNCDGYNILATANSAGKVDLFKLVSLSSNHSFLLSSLESILVEETGISLSLDYLDSCRICVSTDKGNLAVVSNVDSSFQCTHKWKAHDFEAWICAGDRRDNNVVYSGGDDCLFKGWDLRKGPGSIFTNRHHEMGVCSLQFNPEHEHIICSGSYDEHIRFWDKRNFKSPLGKVNVGGDVWRLKWHPLKSDRLLAACMYNGFSIVDMEETFVSGTVVAQYMEHKSLAYGGAWLCNAEGLPSRNLVGTCSFYDHLLTVWEF